jgi:hypothetical protein
MKGIISAWGKILGGYQPNLSIEITRECPLACPGCYAYGGDHLGGDVTLRELRDFKGPELVSAMFALLDTARSSGQRVGNCGEKTALEDGVAVLQPAPI